MAGDPGGKVPGGKVQGRSKSQTKSQRPQTREVIRLRPATIAAGRGHIRRRQATSSDARQPRHRPQPVPPYVPDAARPELAAAVSIALGAPNAVRRSQAPGSERRALSGSAPSGVNGASHPRSARTRLRHAVDPGVSADPAGLTARARPEARPRKRAANLRGGLGTSLEPSQAQQDGHLETLTLP